MEQTKFSIMIMGCCMSRDPFDYCEKETFEITKFISQNSFFTLLNEKNIPDKIKMLSQQFPWTKSWNRTCFDFECECNLENVLKKYNSDFLLIDTYNFTFDLLKINIGDDNIYLTNTSNFSHNKEFLNRFFQCLNAKHQIIYSETISDYLLETAIAKLCKLMLTYYSPSEIFLNEFAMTTKYFDGCDLQDFDNIFVIKKINNIMQKSNRLLIKYLGPDLNIIKFPENIVGDKHHQWGLYNLHVIEEYYRYVIECLNSLIIGKQNQELLKTQFTTLIEKKYFNGGKRNEL